MKTTLYYRIQLSDYDGKLLPAEKNCFDIKGFNESIAAELISFRDKINCRYKTSGIWEFMVDHDEECSQDTLDELKGVIEILGNEGSNVDIEGKYISSNIESNTWTECDINGAAFSLDTSSVSRASGGGGGGGSNNSSPSPVASPLKSSKDRNEKKAKKAQQGASNHEIAGLSNKPKTEKTSSVKNKLAALLERNK